MDKFADELSSLVPLGDIPSLLKRYASGELTPSKVVQAVHARIQNDPDHIWIYRLPFDVLTDYVFKLEARANANDRAALPLYGVPFALKDNIDLAGVPTTAACPAFAYTPQCNATVVQKLIDAGAIPIGKTNLDQFATGLNGTRSPYGACCNAFNPDYISGGSSSGSAVALAKGMVSFSLGTDTAGSGRVPAGFNNLIGYKPTRGWLSTQGVVPACRSLDCVSIFSFTAADAERILGVCAGYDDEDIFSLKTEGREKHGFDLGFRSGFRFAIPRREQLQFFGNSEAERLFDEAVARTQALGGEAVEIDLDPFLEAARLLYGGPWLAERYAAIRQFFEAYSDQVIAPVREIIAGAKGHSAADAFIAQYRLRQLKRRADQVWTKADYLLMPTAGTIYTIDAMRQDPIRLNTNLGYYTNFVNLLDYAAVAVPAGFQNDGLPFGITLIAPAHHDKSLLHVAGRLQQAYALPLGATGISLSEQVPPGQAVFQDGSRAVLPAQATRFTKQFAEKSERIRVAVCGAHLSGLPLNGQLTSRNGQLVATTATSPDYKLYALPGGPPQRPGLVHVERDEQGVAIEVEVWELPASEFGSFVAGIPAPLGIGTLTLADGEVVQGFLCERYAVADAEDISRLGGWRGYLQQIEQS
ncbi:allophanate hydrolase [Nitrosovibrio tenuis]|uniref:Allophanate hydrolase n=1 Tax=Nitrosovibrio tenuis TaxID=1233 RepID=A0A1H7KJS3_9PROT|nr:allophanate hydrolase [Nitrosovibrio tenuis]SEK86764.1 allophanate hydrolase [Nitrosovibrio tenuis]